MKRDGIKGKRISIIGAARSGIASAQLLTSKGAKVFVSDNQPAEKLQPQILELQTSNVEYEIGSHSERVYEADMIVTSPGVQTNSPVLRAATQRGIQVVSELEIASWFCPSPIIAVTGSNGKTTTTALLGRMFSDDHKKHIVAGNIGTPLSLLVTELDKSWVAVLEVSSFQLDYVKHFHPKVSVILNITPDHLDRYDHSFDKYVGSKCRVFENQTLRDFLIYNEDDTVTRENVTALARSKGHLLPFSQEKKLEEGAFVADGMLVTRINGKESAIVMTGEISIKGAHNLYNSMAAALAAQMMGVSIPSIRATLKNFKGVEHRLEFVREVNGVRYINDSKATNVDSVWYALQAFQDPILLLLGGRDKGNDYSRLVEVVEQHVKAIIAMGESADKVVKEFTSHTHVVKSSSMDEALRKAGELARSGDIVLLSPACASFDWFQNYEHRGRAFKEFVNAL